MTIPPSTAPRSAAESSPRPPWLLLLLALLLLAAGIGLRDPTPADEPRFALVAKAMVENGNWLIPHRGSMLYSDKPPLFMVLQALAYTFTGSWRLAFLLPSLLASLGTLWLVYDLTARLWSRHAGLYAAGGMLTTVQFIFQAKRGQIDPTVCFFMTLANYGLLRHLLLGPHWRAYWLGCFAAGLGVITKGVGMLTLLMLLPYAYARWRHWPGLAAIPRRPWAWLGGLLALLAALALWLGPLLVYIQTHPDPALKAYLHDILFHQTVDRYTHPWNGQHPPWYYLEVILSSWLPLILALPWVYPSWRGALRARDPRLILPLTWVVLLILFFSGTAAKRDVYIMPALPMLALCLGPWLETARRARGCRWLLATLAAVLALIPLAGGLDAWLGHPDFARQLARKYPSLSTTQLHGLWQTLALAGGLSLLVLACCGIKRVLIALLFALASLWYAWSLKLNPLLAQASSPVLMIQRLDATLPPADALAIIAWKEELAFALNRPYTDFGFDTPWHQQLAASLRWQQVAPAHRWVLAPADVLPPCIDTTRTLALGEVNRHSWRLFRLDAVNPACRDGKVPAPIGRRDGW